jgi:phage-related protein
MEFGNSLAYLGRSLNMTSVNFHNVSLSLNEDSDNPIATFFEEASFNISDIASRFMNISQNLINIAPAFDDEIDNLTQSQLDELETSLNQTRDMISQTFDALNQVSDRFSRACRAIRQRIRELNAGMRLIVRARESIDEFSSA